MDERTVEGIRGWEPRPFSGGYGGLRDLADRAFTGAVETDTGEWAFLVNGRVVGVFERREVPGGDPEASPVDIERFEGASGTAYAAPHPSLPLLYAMRATGGEERGRYYTEQTPLSEVDATLREGRFTGYLELSENVLSGDYYVVYHGGKSLSVAFVGNARRVVTGDEAYERAGDEVGIYSVVAVDLDVVEVPGGASGGTAAGVAGSTGDQPDTGQADMGPADTGPDAGSYPDPDTNDARPVDDEASVDRDPTADTGGGGTSAGPGPGPGDATRDEARAGSGSGTDTGDGTDTDVRDGASEFDSLNAFAPDAGDEGEPGDDGAAEESGTGDEPTSDRATGAGAGGDAAGDGTRPETDDAEESGTVGTGAADVGSDAASGPALGEGLDDGLTPAVRRVDAGGVEEDAATDTAPATDDATPRGAVGEPEDGVTTDAADDGEGVAAVRERLAERERELATARDRLEAVRAERDELESEVEHLRARVSELEAEVAGPSDPEASGLAPDEALAGTHLFVRYRSKGEPTLADVDRADRETVERNLRLEHHATFDPAEVVVDGTPFEEFLAGTQQYRFVEWLVGTLPFEIREAGERDAMRKLYEAIPAIDRVEFDAAVAVKADGGRELPFDVVCRDDRGTPLVVGTLEATREPVGQSRIADLVTDAEAVGRETEALAGAFAVTASYFDPGAMRTTEEATGGSLLSRDKRASYVKLSRNRGFHLCLAEARDGAFYLTVPDL